MRRTKEASAQTRLDILKAGLQEFSEKGYESSTLSSIAKRAGVTRGAVYWHFRDKRHLYYETLEHHYRPMDMRLDLIVESDKPASKKLEEVFLEAFRSLQSDHEFRAAEKLFMSRLYTTGGPAEASDIDNQIFNNLLGWVSKLVKEAQADGCYRDDVDPDTVTLAVIGFFQGIESLWLTDESRFQIGKLSEVFTKIIRIGIENP